MSHSSILKYIPIINKYRFFFKTWLSTPIYRTKTLNDNGTIKIIPRCGVAQGSIISPIIYNFVLDNLEKFLLKNLPSKYNFDYKEINSIYSQFGQEKVDYYKNFSNWLKVKVRIYRYVDEILILGNASQKHFINIYKCLVLFLKNRGLNLKIKEKPIKVFLPEVKFEFLGFRFQFANSNNSIINRGKYTRYSLLEQFIISNGFHTVRCCDGLFIIICPKFYKLIMSRFKLLFTRNKIGFPIKIIIKHYNELLTSIIRYFGVTKSIKIQLIKFNYLAYLKFKKLLFKNFHLNQN